MGQGSNYKLHGGKGDLVSHVVSLNLTRRHLNESQRAIVAARIKPMFEEAAKERMLAGKKVNPSANLRGGTEVHKAAEDAAKLLNVSPRTVESGSRVLSHGTPELVQAVENGEIKVSTAATLTKLPADQQK